MRSIYYVDLVCISIIIRPEPNSLTCLDATTRTRQSYNKLKLRNSIKKKSFIQTLGIEFFLIRDKNKRREISPPLRKFISSAIKSTIVSVNLMASNIS